MLGSVSSTPERLAALTSSADTRACDHLLDLPVELLTIAFQHVAHDTKSASIIEFLNYRLVCKRFDQLVQLNHVAHLAVVGANGPLLRRNMDQRPQTKDMTIFKYKDVPVSWWNVLMHQRRIDRVWLGGSVMPEDTSPSVNGGTEAFDAAAAAHDTIRSEPTGDAPEKSTQFMFSFDKNGPLYNTNTTSGHAEDVQVNARDQVQAGYEVIVLDTASKMCGSTLQTYASLCADLPTVAANEATSTDTPLPEDSNTAETGAVIAFLAHRTATRSKKPFPFVTVHFLAYPSLQPLAAHKVTQFGPLSRRHDFYLDGIALYYARAPAQSSTTSGSASASTAPPAPRYEQLVADRTWNMFLGHVDYQKRLYSLVYSDALTGSIVALFSFARGVADAKTKLLSSIFLNTIRLEDIKVSLIPTQPDIVRIIFIDQSTKRINIVTVDRNTLIPRPNSHILILNSIIASRFEYSPLQCPDQLIVCVQASSFFVVNVNTGKVMVTVKLPVPASRPLHVPVPISVFHRPMLPELDLDAANVPLSLGWQQWIVQHSPAAAPPAHPAANGQTAANPATHFGQIVGTVPDTSPVYPKPKSKRNIVAWVPQVSIRASHAFNEFANPETYRRTLLGAHLHVDLAANGCLSLSDLRRPEGTQGDGAVVRLWSVDPNWIASVQKGVPSASLVGPARQSFDLKMTRLGPAEVSQMLQRQGPEPAGEAIMGPGRDMTGDVLAVGQRGDALLVRCGSVLVLLRKCADK